MSERYADRAPAKVNLCLFLGGLRDDGRHRLLTLFESVSLCDELELSVLGPGGEDEVLCPGVEGENLAQSALRELRRRGWVAPAVRLQIDKRIPLAAGLGGGSADAAATLRLAARLAPAAEVTLREIAVDLGADVPFALQPGVSIGTGAGEIVNPVEALADHAFLILPSEEMLSTPAVYGEADRLGLGRPDGELEALEARLRSGVEGGGGRLDSALAVNDLEPAALSLTPGIAEALEAARATGAEEALVCGSGPTVAGVWWGDGAMMRAEAAAVELKPRFPGAVAARPVSSSPSGTIV